MAPGSSSMRGQPLGVGAERPAERDEIGVAEVGIEDLAVAALLGRLNHAVGVVVDDDHGDGQLVLHRGGQLLQREEEAAVAGEHGDRRVRLGNLGANADRQAETERGRAGGIEEAARRERREVADAPVAGDGLVAGEDARRG